MKMKDLVDQSIKRTEARIAALITLQGKNSMEVKREVIILHKLLKAKNRMQEDERNRLN